MNKKKELLTLKLLLLSTLSLSGCGKKADCDIEEYHAHKYVNSDGLVRYVDSENLTYEGYTRTDDYIIVEKDDKIFRYEDKKDLLKIEDNLDVIKEQEEENQDYLEYEYKYTYVSFNSDGDMKIKTSTSWTTDSNHDGLTGKKRIVHYVYDAYKIYYNDKGKVKVEHIDNLENLEDTMEDYQYIKKNYYHTTYKEK